MSIVDSYNNYEDFFLEWVKGIGIYRYMTF